jgi:hypothetical protein
MLINQETVSLNDSGIHRLEVSLGRVESQAKTNSILILDEDKTGKVKERLDQLKREFESYDQQRQQEQFNSQH